MEEENTVLDLGYFRVTLEAKIKNNSHKIFALPKGGGIRTSFIECLKFAGII